MVENKNALLCNSTNASTFHFIILSLHEENSDKSSVIKVAYSRKELKMYCIRKLSLVLLLLSKLCLGWNLPPVNFLSEFAKRNDRAQLSISVPFGIPSMNRYFGQLTRSVISYEVILNTLISIKQEF